MYGGNMLVTTQYLFLPGVCSLCGSSHLPTIDTGIDLDWQNSPFMPANDQASGLMVGKKSTSLIDS